MANVEQTQKMIPFMTCKISLCQYVCELVSGVNVLDLDFGVQMDSIEYPVKGNSVGPGNMSHCGTSSLYDHLDHCFVVFKHNKASRCENWTLEGRVNIIQNIEHSSRLLALRVTCVTANNGLPRSIMVLSRVSKN